MATKKALEISLTTRKTWLDQKSKLSIRKQCELLGINRSSLYYEAVKANEFNLLLMRLLDKQYTKTPFYGVKRMTAILRRKGYKVNEKRVRRLLRLMGLEAVYAKMNVSKANREHKIFPYLLNDVEVEKNDQVWSTDITYIRLKGGFVYLMAIIDWYSRYVLSWSLSTTLAADFCVDAVKDLLTKGKRCEIFNTDQGAQFTTPQFTEPLLDKDIKVSMDGRSRALDNVFVERLWRSVKYECVYLHEWQTVRQAKDGLSAYFDFYNNERLHQSLDYATPSEIYLSQTNGRY